MPDRYGTEEMDFEVTRTSGTERLARVRSATQARCPGCNRHTAKGDVKLTGLLLIGDHLVWRHHDIITWAGTHAPCSVGGTRACENPPASVAHVEAARCPHA